LLHELMHILGFSALFADGRFVNPKTGEIIAALTSQVLKSGKNATFLSTPPAVKAARSHFQCDQLVGAELEEEASHWEARVFPDELMAPVVADSFTQPVLSAMTLAFFESFGSYLVDYSSAAELAFGRGIGCSVPLEPCDKRPSPFNLCSRASQGCSFDRSGFGACNLFDYSKADGTCPLQQWQRVFSNCSGGELFFDLCSIVPDALNCADVDGVTKVNAPMVGSETAYLGQVGGPTSMCFDSTVISAGFRTGLSVGCFPRLCAASDKLSVIVAGKTFECPSAGGTIPVSVVSGTGNRNFNGTIVCPPAKEVCCECKNSGRCVLGKCVCPAAFTGPTCETIVAPSVATTLPNPARWQSNPFANENLIVTRLSSRRNIAAPNAGVALTSTFSVFFAVVVLSVQL
jgi:hypothetical protein